LLRIGPAQQVPQAGKQFRQCEWFGEVVVTTLLQSKDTFVDRPSRRENQNGRIAALRPASPNEIQAVAIRQTEVDDERIMNAFQCQNFGCGGVGSGIRLISRFCQSTFDKFANSPVVFYKKEPHYSCTGNFSDRQFQSLDRMLSIALGGFANMNALSSGGHIAQSKARFHNPLIPWQNDTMICGLRHSFG